MAEDRVPPPPAGFVPVQVQPTTPTTTPRPPAPPSGFVPTASFRNANQDRSELERLQDFASNSPAARLREGIASGAVGIAQGIGELGAAAIDLAFDTDYASGVTNTFQAARESLDLNPEGFLGKGAEIVTQFVIPGIGAANMASKAYSGTRALTALSQGTRSARIGNAAVQLGAAGLADAVVSNDGNTTLGDFFDGGPTATDQTLGLSGQEEAIRRITNRLKIGVESGLLGAVAAPALRAAGVLGGAAGRAAAQTAPGRAAVQATERSREGLRQYLRRIEADRLLRPEQQSLTDRIVADTQSMFRYRGMLPEDIAEARLLARAAPGADLRKASVYARGFEKNLESTLGKIENVTPNMTELKRTQAYNTLREYLTTADDAARSKLLRDLPETVRRDAERMSKQLGQMQRSILNSDFLRRVNYVDPKTGNDIRTVIEENLDGYMRRRYQAFENAKYKPTEEVMQTALNGFRRDKSAVEYELTKLTRARPNEFTDEYLRTIGAEKIGAGREARVELFKMTDDAARVARDAFWNRYKPKNRGVFGFKGLRGGRQAIDRLETGLLRERANLRDYQRALLGEIDDPLEAYLGTVADLAQFKAVDKYFGTIRRMAERNEGIGKFFVNPNRMNPEEVQDFLQNRGYVQLGSDQGRSRVAQGPLEEGAEELAESGWGSLNGYLVPGRVYRDLTKQVYGETDTFNEVLRSGYSAFLRAKAASQYTNTVLSPITTLRNVTTAVAFAMANGNVGRGANLLEAADLVWKGLRNVDDDVALELLADAQRRGVLGTNAQLREMYDLMTQGAALTETAEGAARVAGQGTAQNWLRENILDTKIGRHLQTANRFAQDIYQGGDDMWKYYSYVFEQNKLRNALRELTPQEQYKYLTGKDLTEATARRVQNNPEIMEDLLKDRAARIVRDTVPNYDKVPEIVRGVRQLPVGNFVSFPSEIIRTSTNIIDQGLKELNSDIPAIRNIGRRRLIGAATTWGAIPLGMYELGTQLSGVSKDEMEAYRRSFGAPWEKNAMLIPTGRDENGNIEYINFSISNPYDMMSRMLTATMNAFDNAEREGRNPGSALRDAAFGTLAEFFDPFTSEAIVTERLVDVTIRDGRTKTGAQVYNEEDPFGTQLMKSYRHVLDSLLPNFVPVKVSGGEFEPSRFVRGTIGTLFPDIVSPVDRLGRERKLSEELFRTFTGITPMTTDMERSLYYGANRFRGRQAQARRMFNSVADDVNVRPEDLIDAYRRANEAKLRVDNQYFQMIEDLRTMGMSDRNIRRTLSRNNIGGVDDILRGRFEPFPVSDAILDRMRRQGTRSQFPRREIRTLENEFRRINLTADPLPRSTPEPSPADEAQPIVAPVPRTSVPTPPPPLGFTPMPAPTGGGVPPPPPGFVPQQRGAVDPALLGDNPVEQAANMQIARATGRA
jgi:hypothetical protein